VEASAAPLVVVFTGLPGTGKSTMSDLTARRLGIPAFSGDWLLGALQPAHGVLALLDRPTYLRTYHQLLRSLIVRQLMLGQSAIVDCVVDDMTLTDWQMETDSRGCLLYVVECVCSDESLHRQRVEGRTRDIPGWHEVGWDHVLRMRAELSPIRADRLMLDSVQSAPANLELVQKYIRRGRL
jgi:adenylate kinase family enzyme